MFLRVKYGYAVTSVSGPHIGMDFFLNKLPMDRAYPTDPLFIKADIICFQNFFASVSFTSSNIKICYCYLSEAIVLVDEVGFLLLKSFF